MMDGLEEIKKIIKNFAYESKELKTQISEIENKRTQLANERNEKKQYNSNDYTVEINALGKQISELGNKSQELQNKLDFKFNEVKKIVNLTINNLITEGIRNARKIDEEKEEIEEKLFAQKEKNAKYEMQKQEFYERFGRLPELSENAQKEDEAQEKLELMYKNRLQEIENNIRNIETNLVELAEIKRDFRNKCWNNIIESQNKTQDVQEIEKEAEEQAIVLPLMEEEFQIEEAEPIEYIKIQEFEPTEEKEIGEIEIEPYQKIEIKEPEEIVAEPEKVDEIERLARAIVEEIIAEQTKDLNINKSEEEANEQEIITFEENTNKQEVNAKIEKENITLDNIISKVEDGEIVYKAQVSNGEEIKVYPTLEVKNILLNDKEYREEIKEALINYAIEKHKMLDNTVIKKIDPTICEVLEIFAKKYNFNEGELIYNYAMSFSKNGNNEIKDITSITYNFSYLKNTNLSKKEKAILSKICKKAIENSNIDIIGGITGFGKIKYIFKKIFNINTIKALPEGKY